MKASIVTALLGATATATAKVHKAKLTKVPLSEQLVSPVHPSAGGSTKLQCSY